MKKNRMEELINLLNEASLAYYQKDTEIISNFEYDKLYDELVELEKTTGTTYRDSPTKKVGYEIISSLKKVRHDSRMLSLDKTKDIDKLISFLGDEEGLLSWKLDGLTIVLKYENGELVDAVTRGNGEIGEDITHNAKYFKNLPKKISFTNKLVIRGEAIISFSDFEKINDSLAEGEEKYKNPRNLGSGTVRQLNSEIAAKRNVHFFAFSLVEAFEKDFSDLKSNELSFLSELGFEVVEYKKVTQHNLFETVEYFKNHIEKNDFGSDGLVLTYNRIAYSKSLGNTSKFPKDSIAFKWADEVMETTLLKVDWNTSRTGLINPVAIFEPVLLEGTTVNKASLHNVSILQELELGVGDIIKVYKANMIIPQVLDNVTRSNNVVIPDKCPVCESKAEIFEPNGTKCLFCTNPNCNAQLIRSLTHFTSRDAMNIRGLSEATIEKFVQNNFISNYVDIYKIQNFSEEIKTMEGFGEKSYTNLISSIEESKNVQLPNFIYSLGINQVGLSNAKLLCSYYKYDMDKIIEATFEDLQNIDGFGEVISKFIVDYFDNNNNINLLNEAIHILNIEKISEDEGSNTLDGLTFVITGSLEKFKNRSALETIIEKNGGKTTKSVTSKTSYLINNDINSNSSKNKKAKELNVKIITEENFINELLKSN